MILPDSAVCGDAPSVVAAADGDGHEIFESSNGFPPAGDAAGPPHHATVFTNSPEERIARDSNGPGRYKKN